MREWQSQSHVKWYCRYHIVIVPKYRKKAIYGALRKEIGGILKELCGQFGVEWVEGHAMADHIHMCLSIAPKLSVAYTIGRLKGKSAVRIHRDFVKRRGNAKGFNFWSTGYCVSTVGLDEAKVRQYIRHQEERERRQEELDIDD
jgi:putative transposase